MRCTLFREALEQVNRHLEAIHEVNNLIWSGRTLQLLRQHVEIAHSLKGWPEQLRLSAFQLTHFVA